MGVVYRARQISLGRDVALKLISAGHLATVESVQRFRQEAALAARLHHPNIVAVYQVGQHENQHYFAMRLVPGRQNIGSWAKGLVLPPAERMAAIATTMATVARAVAYAHEQGVVHRDLNLSNILIDEKGEPCVVDFGISRLLDGNTDLTLSGQVLGTPRYMAPEQTRGDSRALTPAVDTYSLGAILYELLAGRKVFAGADLLTLLEQIAESPPAPLRLGDRGLEGIVFRCLEKSPASRYGSAAELADDLERWLSGQSLQTRPAWRSRSLAEWVRRRSVRAFFAIMVAAGCATALIVHIRSKGRKIQSAAVDGAASNPSPRAVANHPISPNEMVGDDREAIEWLHRFHGEQGYLNLRRADDQTVMVSSATPLPAGDYAITRLMFAGSPRDPQELPFSTADFRKYTTTLRQLENCFLFDLELTAADLGFLAHSPHLEEIHIRSLPVGDSLIPAIAKLKSLSFLHISYNADRGDELTGHNLDELASLPFLVLADFTYTHFDDVGAAILAERGLELRRVWLEGTHITDAALRSLSHCHLEDLNLAENPALTDAGLADLAKIPVLRVLIITGCTNLTTAGIAAFQRAHPACKIVR